MDFYLVYDLHNLCFNCEESFVDTFVGFIVVFVHDESDPIIKLVVFHGLVGVRLGDLFRV
jgi:hypothetical protein